MEASAPEPFLQRARTLAARLARPGKKSDQMRRTGTLILVVGLIAAGLFYWIEAPPPAPVMDDSIALGYTRGMHHQMEVMMGHVGVIMMGWQDALLGTGAQAITIAVISALLAGYFFRVAWVLDEDEREGLQDGNSLP
jgi:hypothetical protein